MDKKLEKARKEYEREVKACREYGDDLLNYVWELATKDISDVRKIELISKIEWLVNDIFVEGSNYYALRYILNKNGIELSKEDELKLDLGIDIFKDKE